MTFIANETGQGSPVELYQFVRGLDRWTLTPANESVTFQSETYTTLPMRRSKIDWQQEIERSELKVSVPRDAAVVQDFIQFPPTEVMTLTIYRQHVDDVDNEFAVIWQGRVLSAEWQGSEAIISCEPVFTSLKRPGLRRKMQGQCPHVLYGTECKLNNQSFKTAGTISGINGNVISATEWGTFADGSFIGGYVEFGTQRRAIINHIGTDLTLNASLTDLVVTDSVDAFQGCAHDLNDCINKFNNIVNYGGFPFVPGKNPFGGTILF